MENPSSGALDTLWDDLLSQDSELISGAYASLDKEERQAVIAHLNRMATEEGWHVQQRQSAQVALSVLRSRFSFPP